MRYGPSAWVRPEGYPCARRDSMAKAAQIVNCYVYSGLMAPVTEMRVAAGFRPSFGVDGAMIGDTVVMVGQWLFGPERVGLQIKRMGPRKYTPWSKLGSARYGFNER